MKKNDDWSALGEIAKHKRLYLYTSAAALLCSLIISFSIPRQYVSRIIVVPETKHLELSVGSKSGLGTAYFKPSVADTKVDDRAELYIQMLHSDDFRKKVRQLKVHTADSSFTGTYEEYLKTEMKYPWYYDIIYDHTIDDIVDENIRYALDRSHATITMQVSSCDPVLSAMMPQMLMQLLHEKITERFHNLYANMAEDKAEQLAEATAKYKAKQKEYTSFRDSHEGIEDKTYMTVQTTLQREVRTAQAICEQLRTFKERFEMLAVSDNIYLTTVVNPIVARSASNPHYVTNALVWLFYSAVITTLFILYRKKYRMSRRKEAGGNE